MRFSCKTVTLILALSVAPQAFAWQSTPFGVVTDFSLQLDSKHEVLLWFQAGHWIDLQFTKNTLFHGVQTSDQYPALACVESEKTISSTPDELVEDAVLKLPLPSDVKRDLQLPADAVSFLLDFQINTNFTKDGSTHSGTLTAVDAQGDGVRKIFQGPIPQYWHVLPILLPGEEGQYLASPKLRCPEKVLR